MITEKSFKGTNFLFLQSEDKNDLRVKKVIGKDKITSISNTTKLSYRDVLVKGRVNKNKKMEGLMWKIVCET